MDRRRGLDLTNSLLMIKIPFIYSLLLISLLVVCDVEIVAPSEAYEELLNATVNSNDSLIETSWKKFASLEQTANLVDFLAEKEGLNDSDHISYNPHSAVENYYVSNRFISESEFAAYLISALYYQDLNFALFTELYTAESVVLESDNNTLAYKSVDGLPYPFTTKEELEKCWQVIGQWNIIRKSGNYSLSELRENGLRPFLDTDLYWYGGRGGNN